MDDFQKLMVCSLYNPPPLSKTSSQSIHNFLSNPPNKCTHTHQWRHKFAKFHLAFVKIRVPVQTLQHWSYDQKHVIARIILPTAILTTVDQDYVIRC